MNAMPAPLRFTDSASRLDAVRRRDPAADLWFLYSVATTGVVCRPSCAARPALEENIGFHPDLAQALAAGFRPCKRCRPDLPARAERDAALIAQACRTIETAETPPSLITLAAQAGLSPHHFHRLFKSLTSVTPKAYADARRQWRVQQALAQGQTVTAAIYEAGFNSSGRFYEASDNILGMTPTAWRSGAAGETIRYAHADCALGILMVALSARGICAILLGDNAASLAEDLVRRFPRATLQHAEPDLSATIAQVVALVDDPTSRAALSLPLDIRGTAFQRRVWEALRTVPPGTTTSYGNLAMTIDQPRAVRAVAAACAANALAVAIPCHRVIGADGGLAGYRWGLDRKRELLRREAQR